MVKLSFYCLRLYALRKGVSRGSLRPKRQFLESLAPFLAKVNYLGAKADACGTANVLGCTNWGSDNSFWACVWRSHKAQYHQPLSCYVGSRGKGNQSTSSITSSWQITFVNIWLWRQVPHLGWRRQHGLLPQEVRKSLGGDGQVRAWEHATVHTHGSSQKCLQCGSISFLRG